MSVYGCLDPRLHQDVLVLTVISNTSYFKSSTYRQVEINILGTEGELKVGKLLPIIVREIEGDLNGELT